MDVCLVLTHRCNLACHYCYAGDHHARRMEEAVLERAVALLYSDGADRAQLSFFGGEPFLRLDAMRRAVFLARAQAEARGAELSLQCTTNGTLLDGERVAFVRETGMRVTVSIDGVREAHELHRPRAGGGSSYDAAVAGLRALVAAGARPDALMVISPQTVPYVYRSVSWLWDEGIATVRANAVLDAPWDRGDRDELREQLWAVATEMVVRRRRGEGALFDPFAPALRRAAAPARAAAAPRRQVVVATGGHLYPCAPMVGEDRDGGPEAALRIGHLDDGGPAIARAVTARGAGCDSGKGCACAAYLETGDRSTAGPNGLWYGRLCDELGAAAAGALQPARRPAETARRPFLFGLAAAAGGVAIGAPALMRAGLFGDRASTGCELPVADRPAGDLRPLPPEVPVDGEMASPPEPDPEPDPEPPPDEAPPVPGQMLAPPPPPPPEEVMVRGELAAPPEDEPDGPVKGRLRRPD
ncbi:MAG TPA: radical SAM protein [Kofleriaceae bacterium]|nr:radical SAM protein [Kofleriaceae bacterium]